MSRRARRSAQGYSLVILMVIITVMSVMVAVALPQMDTQIQREKEEELIFRGFQYAEAIRVFQRRFGRYPVRLQELYDAKPRCIRQLWKDPMTEKGDWGLVLVTQQMPPGARGRGAAGGQPVVPPGNPTGGDASQNPSDPNAPPGAQPPAPIMGVYSKSDKASIKVLFGQRRYKDWRFTAQILQSAFGVVAQNNIPRSANATWIGRPFEGQGGQTPKPGSGPGETPGVGKPPQQPPHPISWPPPQGQPSTPNPTSDDESE